MLTIDEIRNATFRKAARGYKPEDVNVFIDEVIEYVEELIKEKNIFIGKIDILAKRIEQYREDETNVKNALIASQKMADLTITEANATAKEIVEKAKKQAEEIHNESNLRMVQEKEKYIYLQKDVADLKEGLLEIYKKHLLAINEFPDEESLLKSRQAVENKYPTEPVPGKYIKREPAKREDTKPEMQEEDDDDDYDDDLDTGQISGAAQNDSHQDYVSSVECRHFSRPDVEITPEMFDMDQDEIEFNKEEQANVSKSLFNEEIKLDRSAKKEKTTARTGFRREKVGAHKTQVQVINVNDVAYPNKSSKMNSSDKKNEKFSNLKFGENYDMTD